MYVKFVMPALALGLAMMPAMAQTNEAQEPRLLTIDQCRELAVENNNNLNVAKLKIEAAGYDRKTAFANYFPNISVNATYQYNSRNLKLLERGETEAITQAGTTVQDSFRGQLEGLLSDPLLGAIIKHNPKLQELFAQLSSMDIAGPINAIGQNIDEALTLHIHNVFIGAVSLQQPVFMGGKIVAANKMAKLGEELASAGYDMEYRKIITEVNQAYWQTVSIANKKKLAESYADLLHQMEHDVDVMISEGVATNADALSIKVKANEADMLLTRATNGLILSKMLVCKLCGLDMNSDIILADETIGSMIMPQAVPMKSNEEIFAARPEIRSLELASGIFDQKTNIAKSDMMPKVALTANFFLTSPNIYHGFRNNFAGMFNVGVAVNIPIIHGCEAMQKVRKAKTEAAIMRYKTEDAKEMITLQVCSLRQQLQEAFEHYAMAENNLANAEENLRTATIGFNEGVVPANTAMSAQTAWLQAHSDYIDAGISVQLCTINLSMAEGLEL